ncbi:MAG: hypothetical protein WCE32_03240, partial [Pseudolabrys sp.]
LETINFVEEKMTLSVPFDAPHHMHQPTLCLQDSLRAEEQSQLPFNQHISFRLDHSVSYNGYSSSLRNALKQNSATNPTGATCRWR